MCTAVETRQRAFISPASRGLPLSILTSRNFSRLDLATPASYDYDLEFRLTSDGTKTSVNRTWSLGSAQAPFSPSETYNSPSLSITPTFFKPLLAT